MNVDGSKLRRIFEGDPNTPVWSPDSQKIAFAFNKTPTTGAVCLVEPDGSNLQLLAEGRFGELAWSPDAKSLAVRSRPEDADEEMLLADVVGGRTTLLSTGVASGNWSPSWSPDGGMVALILADGDQRKLAVVPRQPGGTPRGLLRSYSFTTPVWSSDNANPMVSAEQHRGEAPALIRVKVDGSGKQQTLALGEFPSWTK